MRLLYCHDNIYQQCPNGITYSPGQFPYAYWTTFLKDFDHIQVVGRGVGLNEDIRKLNVSSGDNVSFCLFPNINTPMGRLKYTKNVSDRIKKLVEEADAVVVRAVSDLAWIAFKHAHKLGKPIALEMAACAWDSTWNYGNILGKIYAPFRYHHNRIMTREADYVIYVSQEFLQNRYPANGQTAKASNVRISKPNEKTIKARLDKIKHKEEIDHKPTVLGLIGSLDNRIKAVGDVIKALAIVEEQKPGSFIFKHLGPGNPEPHRQAAERLGIADHVFFDGMIRSGDGVLKWLRGVDIYLQPSYQEGVPRATIEAMSMACPVIASKTGGIPELIDEKWLIEPGDIKKLAERILRMLDSPNCQYEAGLKNYDKSLNYTSDKLIPIREAFWRSFCDFAKDKNSSKDIINRQISAAPIV